MSLEVELAAQSFANEYELVDGEMMHEQHAEQFQIPHPVLKRHLNNGHFVELRIDSLRFSMHDEDAAECACVNCNCPMTKPILRHEQPQSLLPLNLPLPNSKGWGEDFWVQIGDREGDFFAGIIDNRLVESSLHELELGQTIFFHRKHILAVHPMHREELVLSMSSTELKQLAQWLGAG